MSMNKKSKRKEAVMEKTVRKNDMMEDVKDQTTNQLMCVLAESFDKSAAFFGKKVSYAPVVAEVEKKETMNEKLTENTMNIVTKEKKKNVYKETQESENVPEKQKEEGDKKKADSEENDVVKAEKMKTKTKKKRDKEQKEQDITLKDEKESALEDEKARRTVFVGNASLDATQKDLKKHFAVCGKVANVRLRHLPIAGCAVDQAGNQKLMMKVCANKKILTTVKDHCNAYVTFVEERSVDAALKLNGTILVQKKIRVDRSKPVVDARHSIFLGNVPFKCRNDQMMQFFAKRLRSEDEPEPIKNVRLIRDRESGLGKGFGYLLLKTQGLVAKALALRDLKMENRELRVQVCGKRFKNLRGDEVVKEKFEGLRSSAGARARIQLKRKANAAASDRGLMTKKMKRTAAAAGLGKELKPKHAARKAAVAAADTAKTMNKRKHNSSNSKKVTTFKAKKPKHVERKAKQATANDQIR